MRRAKSQISGASTSSRNIKKILRPRLEYKCEEGFNNNEVKKALLESIYEKEKHDKRQAAEGKQKYEGRGVEARHEKRRRNKEHFHSIEEQVIPSTEDFLRFISLDYSNDVTYTRDSCWLPTPYRRAVIIVIDALRYDFALYPRHSENSGYLSVMNELITLNNGAYVQILIFFYRLETAVFARLVADPPTTTLQRLKGLTTGSLPTFIDMASNFASSEIQEDNWVDQAISRGRNITFLGDDTWVSLFPGRFHRSFHVPSFDINDLDGVDNFIVENLFDELARKDWSILIAHFLGVDHCGHKYGPNHPEMVRKLNQMDNIIRRVVKVLDNETVLLVLGDHGMTETGDHGGDTQLEINAALFMYAKRRLVYSPFPEYVSQIDLVPTLSLLLDSPIPFSNIGIVIDALIPSELRSFALSSNMWQMSRYAHLMADEMPEFYVVLREFEAKEENDLRNIQLMKRLQQLFRFSWTHFSYPFMRVGLESLCEAMFSSFDAYFQVDIKMLFRKIVPSWTIFRSALFFIQISAYLNGSETSNLITLLEATLVSSLIFHFISFFNKLLSFSFSFRYLFSISLIVIHGLSFLSNSYIIFESSSVRFLLQTVLVVALFSDIPCRFYLGRKRGISFNVLYNNHFVRRVVTTFIILLLLRIGGVFEQCREEQGLTCEASFLSQPTGKLQDDSQKIIRYLAGVGMVIIAVYKARRILHPTFPFISTLLLPTMVAMFSAWLTLLLPEKAFERFSDFSLVSAQVVYILVVISAIYIFSFSMTNEMHILCGCSLSFIVFISLYLCLLLGDSLSIKVVLMVSYVLLETHGFYALSHHATFSTIPWQAGFVGVEGNFYFQAVPAVLVISHLFSSYIIVVLTIPYSLAKHAKLDPFCSTNGLVRRSSLFLFLQTLQVLCICISAFIHRRHLMVWKIFAPKNMNRVVNTHSLLKSK
uniref:GPI ethanolamine phosphate transferase 3 n=1 Tax=Syphacia muris TaxID=451379 RepID=A0A0N5AMA1_9BILA